jgi:hypothetical protein
LFLAFSVILCSHTEVSAQRARKHRAGLLDADSIRQQHIADSLALMDSIDINREAILRSMEAPVDTALLAHKNDSLQQQAAMEVPKKRWIPNSNKSVWLAMVLPGAGQIYNRKYWKLPIIYGGFVGCAYALTWNSQMYKDYSQAYQDIMSNNPSQDSYLDFLPPGYTVEDVNRQLEYFQSTFKRKKDAYRRQRDLSVFVFIGVYLLSVIDAYVDAELSDFDISKDLSMTFEPAVFNDVHRGYPEAIGIRCSIKF